MVPYIPQALRDKITVVARERCGYCLTPQRISGAQMHIEHIIPTARGGVTEESNLWLSCARCNTHKSDRTHAIDPVTGELAPLFNPRIQTWSEHFTWDETFTHILGLTPTGRATVIALCMNHDVIVSARRFWVQAGWRPAGG